MTTKTQPLMNKLGATEGIYLNQQGIFKLYRTQSGYLFAKHLQKDGTWVGFPGAANKLRPETKMTLEQAKHYGKMYGMCIVCGRTLTDEESIAKGIGPVCEANM